MWECTKDFPYPLKLWLWKHPVRPLVQLSLALLCGFFGCQGTGESLQDMTVYYQQPVCFLPLPSVFPGLFNFPIEAVYPKRRLAEYLGVSWGTLKGLICGSAARDDALGLAGMEFTFPKAVLLVLCRVLCSWEGVGSTQLWLLLNGAHSSQPDSPPPPKAIRLGVGGMLGGQWHPIAPAIHVPFKCWLLLCPCCAVCSSGLESCCEGKLQALLQGWLLGASPGLSCSWLVDQAQISVWGTVNALSWAPWLLVRGCPASLGDLRGSGRMLQGWEEASSLEG